jgi:acyl dehydratase
MSLNVEQLLSKRFPEVRHTYTWADTVRYGLSLGLGMNPTDARQLRFVYEECQGGLRALPSMAAVLAYPGFWSRDPELGLDWKRIVHGEQYIVLHRPVPVEATVVARTRVVDVIDKGAGKGALLVSERTVRDEETQQSIATVRMVTFARGDGGHGGSTTEQPALHKIPQRLPDLTSDFATSPQAGLMYRLAGDLNPGHADPRVAAAAGFNAPILHGLCTLGVACHRIVDAVCDGDPGVLRSLSCRFTSPVYPGETIRTEMWVDADVVSYRASIPARGVTVLDHGRADIG